MLLNTADSLYAGTDPVDRVYLGSEQVWPTGGWTPTDLSGCVLALEAEDIGAGTITTWPDRSPAGNDVYVETGAPTATATYAAALSPGNALRTTDPLPMTGNLPRHFCTLIRSRSVGGAFMGYGANGAGSLFDFWNYNPGTLIWHGYGGGFDTVGGAPAFSPDTWHVVECWYDGATIRIRVDGVGTQVTIGIGTASAPWTFGHGSYSPNGDFDIAAFYAYDRALTDPERVQVSDYLGAKSP